ncbi:MAG: sugar ABC transporter ATP-binding protein [Planctomycetota bacterium]|jgi:ABC-type sugar transport system ATPase subunit|nr:sugar ABC transporter ATP-binding protein [Planctomycetota bacterium]
MSGYILEMRNIRKEFPGVVALDAIRFAVKPGEIHALLGENGAGKSTLIKILAGIYRPDAGEILIEDAPARINAVADARAAGIGVIHQELSLARNMTVAENIFLGRIPANRLGLADENALWRRAKEVLDSIGLSRLDPDTRVSRLSVAQQQLVEICRALSEKTKILIMDEPTASLATAEVETLHNIMRSLKRQGVTIIYISHKLAEIFAVCDRITVLRDGRYVGDSDVAAITHNALINMMVGRDIDHIFPPHANRPGEVVFAAKGIKSARVRDVGFDVRRGEVVGFYGLMGSGRSEVMRALLGLDRGVKESVTLMGKPLAIRRPQDAIAAGVVLAPEDRKLEGLILKQTLEFNITLPIIRRLISFLALNRKLHDEIVAGIGARLRIKAAAYDQRALNLSGGNQQKVVLAKWLVTEPKILILDEPTRGIDVGAKREIYRLIYEIADSGVGVVLISSEMPEVVNLCDRVYVLHEGRLTGVVERKDLTEQTIMRYAIGGVNP